ncbi:phage tail protein, partial [Spartinivicinus marinus]|uniref:phage tail protein n=1 Tax=Spartinivicinus marinus TaxID=2994442 RepID=UPI001C5CB8C8
PTKVDVGLGNLPNAKTDAINENNSNILATARAVKTAYDKANAALPKTGGTITGALTCKEVVSLNQNGKTLNLNTGDNFSNFSEFTLTVSTYYGKTCMGMNNGDFSHFYTQAPKYYFDKPIHVHGELYAGSNYGHRVYHEGYKPTKVDVGLGNLPNAKTDAINENNSNILATARAVKTAYDRAIADAIKPGMIMMWAGVANQVPAGWALCYGSGHCSNGIPIPDLRDRFIVGAGHSYGPGSTGGANTKHTSTAGHHAHNIVVHGHSLSHAQLPHTSIQLPIMGAAGGGSAASWEAQVGQNWDNVPLHI